MIKHPAKDPVAIGLGILISAIIVFLAYQGVLLSGSLSKYRVNIEKMFSRSNKEIQENRDATKLNQDEIRQNRVVNKENQEEILKSRIADKDNSATLERIEKRLSDLEQEIKRLHSENPGQR